MPQNEDKQNIARTKQKVLANLIEPKYERKQPSPANDITENATLQKNQFSTATKAKVPLPKYIFA